MVSIRGVIVGDAAGRLGEGRHAVDQAERRAIAQCVGRSSRRTARRMLATSRVYRGVFCNAEKGLSPAVIIA